MKVIFELFYTSWPFLFKISTVFLWLFFWMMESLNKLLSFFRPERELYTFEFIVPLIYSFFLVNGIIFVEKLLFKLLKKKIIINWFKVWLVQFMIVFLIINHFFFSNFEHNQIAILGLIIIFAVGISATFIQLLKYVVKLGFSLGKWSKKLPKIPSKVVKTSLILIYSYPFLVGLSVWFWFLNPDHPQASRFHIINAAVKNTCFIDSDRENCPQTLEEISYIEPSKYQELIDCCQVNYRYDQEANLYSLVVRYSPTRAVLFDWRLVDEFGLDFKEYEVEVLGQDRLKDAPEWAGPWEFADWEYL